tara:strand:- start:1136 stop:1780 length:645 start_codon:yes stop_codon:yes gene_type:complete
MAQNNELIPLFPAPLMVFPYLRDYSKELEWIKDCKCGAVKETKGRRNRASLNRQSEDTFILDNPELKKIRTFIETKLNQFVSQIYGSDDRLVITQSWLNRNGKGESHHEHTHPNSMISGVWYPQIHEQLPPIEFRNRSQRDVVLSIQRYNTFNSQSFLLPIKRGELILFPSNLTHGVPPNQSDEERISLSFNTWPKGSLGDISSLTFLPFDRLT